MALYHSVEKVPGPLPTLKLDCVAQPTVSWLHCTSKSCAVPAPATVTTTRPKSCSAPVSTISHEPTGALLTCQTLPVVTPSLIAEAVATVSPDQLHAFAP